MSDIDRQREYTIAKMTGMMGDDEASGSYQDEA